MQPIARTRPSLLARLAGASDRHAWREFEEAYGALILHYARRRGLQLADAEDVRQVVMFKLYRSSSGFRYSPDRGRFRDYLWRCVENAVADRAGSHKRAARAVPVDEDQLPAAPTDDLRRSWEDEWTVHHYRRAWRRLKTCSSAQTMALYELIVRGVPDSEAAAAASITETAVRKARQRLRERLTTLIHAQIADEEADPL